MVRRYAEPITVTVHAGRAGHLDHAPATDVDVPSIEPSRWYAAEPPAAFQWRGRRYRVRAVLAHWRERRAWWREVFDTEPAGAPPIPGARIAAAARERHVWRVEAVAGEAGRTVGVFELACDEGDPPSLSRWQLLRIAD